MKLYHTSPAIISKIEKYGSFDDCLFFSQDVYYMTSDIDNAKIYSIDIDETKILDLQSFQFSEKYTQYEETINVILSKIENRLDITNEQAFDLLFDNISLYDLKELNEDMQEDSWWIQAQQGSLAKKIGYEATKSTDEQGTVYIVPMLDREKDLILN